MSEEYSDYLPRYYADVWDSMPPEYSEYKTFVPIFGPLDSYELIK